MANSLHICTEILKDLDEMLDQETSKDLEFHKEETKDRVKSDEEDRVGLRDTLKKCINPLVTDVNGLVNTYTGITVQNSNIYESVKLGEEQRQQSEAKWPDGFSNVIKKEVRTMKSGKKCSKSGEIEVFNTELIYSRVMCLLSIGRTTLEDVFKYELSPIPLSLFEITGERRASKSKSDLKSTSSEDVFLQPKPNFVIIDGYAQLWATSWPTKGTVKDLGDAPHHLFCHI